MPDPGPDPFPCIGCGSMIPIGSDQCPDCRYQFREPAPDVLWIPDDPPETRIVKAPTFRIGTAMVLIAVVALCFGAISADPALGILACLFLLPSSFRLAFLSARREAEGRPMSRDDKMLSFIATAGSVILIAAPSIFVFVASIICLKGFLLVEFRLSLVDATLVVVSLIPAIIVGGFLTRILLKVSRAEERRERDWEALHGRRSGR